MLFEEVIHLIISLSVCCADHDFILLEIRNVKEKYENSVENHLCHYSFTQLQEVSMGG